MKTEKPQGKPIAFVDVDGTLTTEGSSWESAHRHFGVYEQSLIHTRSFFDGKIDEKEWARLDLTLWEGKTKKDFVEALLPPTLREGAPEGIALLRRTGYEVVLLSGGIDIIVDAVHDLVGSDHAFRNPLVFGGDGVLSGVDIHVSMNKETRAREFCDKRGINIEHCVAIGDSVNDVSLFEACGSSLAISPTHEHVADAAVHVSRQYSFLKAVEEFLEVLND